MLNELFHDGWFNHNNSVFTPWSKKKNLFLDFNIIGNGKSVWCPDRAILESLTVRTSQLHTTLIGADTQVHIAHR